ncbi:MAG: hypothetical protein CL940_12405 [Deltaproteobacteria bacterium]|nr:hypothetical protein [Deltaproteobacteria bacterium]
MRNSSWSLSERLVALVIGLVSLMLGCDQPCDELETRVCERHEDRLRCELMQDASRRALLSDEACESMLRVVPKG